MWVQPTNWYFTQWCFEPMAGTHHVNHAMPNTKSNPHEMPYVASNTHGNVMPKKAGFKLYFSQQANTAAQWSMIVWLPSCMASWIPKTPGCSGAEQKMVPAALWPMGSQHHSRLVSGLASNIGCWCHSMALPQLLSLVLFGHSSLFPGLVLGFIILVFLVRHGAQLGPCFIPLGNEILEPRMVGKVHSLWAFQKGKGHLNCCASNSPSHKAIAKTVATKLALPCLQKEACCISAEARYVCPQSHAPN